MKIHVFVAALLVFAVQCLSAQNFKYGRVSKEEIEEKQHPFHPDADAAILYREVKTTFNYTQDAGFTLVTEVFERVKIYSQKGMEWANKKVELRKTDGSTEEISNIKGATYNLEGGKVVSEKLKNSSVFKQQVNRFWHEASIVMPNVREGSVIEYSYTIRSPYDSFIENYEIQYEIPVNKVSILFTAPEYYEYKLHQSGWLKIPVKTYKTDRKLFYRYTSSMGSGREKGFQSSSNQEVDFIENNYTVEMDNVPPMVDEPYSISKSNYQAALAFELSYVKFPGATGKNFAMTWEGVAKSIYERPSFGGELSKTGYFKNDLETIMAQSSDVQSKIFNIYNFVKNKMSNNGFKSIQSYDGLATAYKSNTGSIADINMILTAMLNNAGVQAHPILVSTKSNGIPLFPTINGFDYVICGAVVNNKIILLDASDKYLVPNMLHPEVINWQGRMVKKDGSSDWVPIYNSQEQARFNAMVNAEIIDKSVVKGNVKTQLTGLLAYLHRKEFANVHAESRIKKIDLNYQIESENIDSQNMNNVYENITESYDFSAENWVEEIGGKLYIHPLLFFTEKENLFKAEERIYPVDYSFPTDYRFMVNLQIPEGYQVESLPQNITVQMPDNYGQFRFLISNQGHQIQISAQRSINQSLIPTELYSDLKEFYQTMVDKMNDKIVLVKI